MTTINDDMLSAPGKALGLYLHIPFCVRKCNYCDFLSFAGIPGDVQNEYFQALLREIGLRGMINRNNYYVNTIFIGGGTPSLLEGNRINELLLAVRNSFTVAEGAEISIESNPKTITKNKLNSWLNAGVNRLSIGAQSFDDRLLSDMGRVHSGGDFLMNYSLARECGFRNINIDLMFAIPGQTMRIWMDTLERAVALEPEHISFYSLQLEEGTPFFSLFKAGGLKLIDDELDRAMYHAAVKALQENGYAHYEISNAAKDGYRCRHNLKYWSMEDYLGLGLGACSFLDGTRSGNTADLQEYIQAGRDDSILDNPGSARAGSSFVRWSHMNTMEENISEYLFTGMRKIEGIDLTDFCERFGAGLESIHGRAIEKYRKERLIEIDGCRLRFTGKGIDISNRVLADFV